MSRLEELIAEHCPDGVEHKKLGDVCEIGTGRGNRQDAVDDGEYPFYVRSAEPLKSDTYLYDEEAIIVPGEGRVGEIYHYIVGKYNLHQRAYRIAGKDETINLKFVLYYMKSHFKKFILMRAVTGTVLSIRKPMLTDFQIPVPPIDVQHEIVRILDTFTELTQELTQERELREKQYNYYRDTLLTFGDDVEVKKLGDICEIVRGERVTKGQLAVDGEYPVVSGGTGYMGYFDTFNREGENITIAQYGSAGTIMWHDYKFWANDVCYTVIPKDDTLNKRYLYYVIMSKENAISSMVNRNAFPYSLSRDSLNLLTIPIPPIEVQNEIVAILDRFNTLANDIDHGLPKEIELRTKQYEYYRDQLLTFKEVTA